MNDVFLSLGSNVGDREGYLINAMRAISLIEGTTIKKISSLYETEPVGYQEQECFLNMAMWIETSLQATRLLKKLQDIETRLERTRGIRWGPRTLDIDILLYGEEKIILPELTLPHPRMFERAFVLIPLNEILGKKNVGFDIDKLIDLCNDKWGVQFYKHFDREKIE